MIRFDLKNIAPVALFVYARPYHTKRTIDALKKNTLSKFTDLHVFLDGSKSDKDIENIKEVLCIVNNIQGFKSVVLHKNNNNIGLAKSITTGITKILDVYRSVIVVEDDLITSPHFLTFMNESLELYYKSSDVWHVSGWNYPINTKNMGDAYLWRVMNCWGWATWHDRWSYYKKDPMGLIDGWSISDKAMFNVESSHSFYSQILGNYLGVNDTWAVFWYATIYNNNGLCLTVSDSLVYNIGCDNSGSHKAPEQLIQNVPSEKQCFKYPDKIQENDLAIGELIGYFRSVTSIFQMTINRIKQIMPSYSIVLWKKIRDFKHGK